MSIVLDGTTGLAGAATGALNGTLGAATPSTVVATTGTFSGLIAANGGGIIFPATQVASANANTLGDYEEGAWTPSLTFNGGSTGLTYASRAGYYRKIGSLVQAQCYVYLSNKGSSTGTALLEGLPFVSNNQSNGYCAGTFWASAISSSGSLETYIPPGYTRFQLQQISTSGTNANLTDSNFGNYSEIMVTVTYQSS